MITINFKIWLNEVGGATSVVFDPKKKSNDWNWEGSPGKLAGVSPKEGPINKKKKNGK